MKRVLAIFSSAEEASELFEEPTSGLGSLELGKRLLKVWVGNVTSSKIEEVRSGRDALELWHRVHKLKLLRNFKLINFYYLGTTDSFNDLEIDSSRLLIKEVQSVPTNHNLFSKGLFRLRIASSIKNEIVEIVKFDFSLVALITSTFIDLHHFLLGLKSVLMLLQ